MSKFSQEIIGPAKEMNKSLKELCTNFTKKTNLRIAVSVAIMNTDGETCCNMAYSGITLPQEGSHLEIMASRMHGCVTDHIQKFLKNNDIY